MCFIRPRDRRSVRPTASTLPTPPTESNSDTAGSFCCGCCCPTSCSPLPPPLHLCPFFAPAPAALGAVAAAACRTISARHAPASLAIIHPPTMSRFLRVHVFAYMYVRDRLDR